MSRYPGCWRSALGALPGLVDSCQEAGWTVGQLAEHRGDGTYPARSAQDL